MNNFSATGRLVKDPILRKTGSGKSVTNFTLAVNRDVKDAEGNYTADFIPCTCWNKTAEYVDSYIPKGALIEVQGELQVSSGKNADGTWKNGFSVICMKVRKLSSEKKETISNDEINSWSPPVAEGHQTVEHVVIQEDDLPF